MRRYLAAKFQEKFVNTAMYIQPIQEHLKVDLAIELAGYSAGV
jgi:hypothetical protein